jgi:hypothetical protein
MTNPTTPELPPERCGTCSMARPADDASGVLHAAGWLHCDLMRPYEFCSPFYECHFIPMRWKPKPERRG